MNEHEERIAAIRKTYTEETVGVYFTPRADVLFLLERLHEAGEENYDLRELVKETSEDSVCSYTDDPGCFWCDSFEQHEKRCRALAALGGK